MPPNSVPRWRATVTVKLWRQIEQAVLTNPCLASKWEAEDAYIFLVFFSLSSLLSFIFANISLPVVPCLCQLQSPLCDSLAPRFRTLRSWDAGHTCQICLIKWCSVVTSMMWSIHLPGEKINSTDMFGQCTSTLIVFGLNQVLPNSFWLGFGNIFLQHNVCPCGIPQTSFWLVKLAALETSSFHALAKMSKPSCVILDVRY